MCSAVKDTLALDPGKLYAVAPSPFFASPVGPGAPQGSEADGGAMVTLSVTTDTQVPARRVALPSWFAAEFCAFRDVASLPADPPKGTAFVYEQEAIDPVPRMLITPERSLHAMKRVGGLRCQTPSSIWTAPPVNQSATAEERAAFATASAALIFRTLRTVPRGVVPSLVLEHVVAPYAAGVRCTMEQGMLGVTELTQTDGWATLRFGSGATPNLRKLTLSTESSSFGSSYKGPLPPSITSLVLRTRTVGQISHCGMSNLHTAPMLTSLDVESNVWEGDLPANPAPTVVRLTLLSLGDSSKFWSDNAPLFHSFGRAFPNVKSLLVRSGGVPFAFEDPQFWPHLTELDANVKLAALIGLKRPKGWRRLTMRSTGTVREEDMFNIRSGPGSVLRMPDLLHLAVLFPATSMDAIEAPALQTLYLTAGGCDPWRASVPPSFTVNGINTCYGEASTRPHIVQHVSIDAPPTGSNDPRVRALVTEIAAKIGPSLRFVTCRPGRVWGLSPEMTWVEGAVVPPHLIMREDGEATSPEPPRMCQCLLAP